MGRVLLEFAHRAPDFAGPALPGIFLYAYPHRVKSSHPRPKTKI